MKSAPPGDAGLGLAGTAGRAALYGGTVSAGPAPDGGWTVHATLKAADAQPLQRFGFRIAHGASGRRGRAGHPTASAA